MYIYIYIYMDIYIYGDRYVYIYISLYKCILYDTYYVLYISYFETPATHPACLAATPPWHPGHHLEASLNGNWLVVKLTGSPWKITMFNM